MRALLHGRVDECLNVAKIFIKCWHFGLKRTEYQPRMVKKQEATEAAVVLGCEVPQSSVTNGLVASCAFIAARRSERFVAAGWGVVVVDSGGDWRDHCRGLFQIPVAA